MGAFFGLLRSVALVAISPLLLAVPALALLLSDLLYFVWRPKRSPLNQQPSTKSATVVIPNWNGRDLLSRYLPTVVAAMSGDPANEIVVVDNGSEDGSAAFVRENFPGIRLLALEKNHGFGGGSNAGFEAAANDIVVLLNSDMRVDPDFLEPLLEGFTDDAVFAVSCQIFFSDPLKPREETGLTEGWWENGSVRLRHRVDDHVGRLFPCFYGGGGSCAFDRRKFLSLGGFDSLLAPFYLEDTDLGYLAWKRGWKVLYQPKSRVFHEHRGTIGKRFTARYIQTVLDKNYILFSWKNIHEWRRLISHFGYTFAGGLLSELFGPSPGRATLLGLWRACWQVPRALRSRWRARTLAMVSDTEALRRPLGGYFRDRFVALPPAPERPSVLFVSPYPICPPTHGGAVFMYHACRELAGLTNLHIVAKLDCPGDESAHDELRAASASAEFLYEIARPRKSISSLKPHATREFMSDELRWLIHRKMFLDEIDVLQLEYLPMGQYGGEFKRLASVLFEHDIFFQSIGRSLSRATGFGGKLQHAYEYMRALRYELNLLPRFDQVQVCSKENAEYLKSFLPSLAARIDSEHRPGIDLSSYRYGEEQREPGTMLFLGSFRHQPNVTALRWLVSEVLPLVAAEAPGARLVVVGSGAPPRDVFDNQDSAIELRGFVEDAREPLGRYSLFVCPILAGSGVRVKLLEAFASGIPVVSTRLGAEGLASEDGSVCALADNPATFARKIVELLGNPHLGTQMARRARKHVEAHHDVVPLAKGLFRSYRQMLEQKRRG